jgi:hypothetical protein
VTGGASQIAEHRTGRTDVDGFFESLGGSITQSRATHPDLVERVPSIDDVRTFRISTNTLGAGFVESIANATLLAIRDAQPARMRGSVLRVPVLEANGAARLGRFGWKNQHASLESFSADAYLNEMGITTPFLPEENLSSGRFVGFGSGYDPVAEPEDDGVDVVAFANFMRSTKAPDRGPITPDMLAGERLFHQVGCSVCHVSSIVTAPPGTVEPIPKPHRVSLSRKTGKQEKAPKLVQKRVPERSLFSFFLLQSVAPGSGIGSSAM